MTNCRHKDTTLVFYPAGGYGTFLLWCLYYFTGNLTDDRLPFLNNGSSHRFFQHWFDCQHFGMPPIEEYLSGNTTVPFVRSHGRWDTATNSYNKYITNIIDYFNHIVLLEPGDDDQLLILSNTLSKTAVTKDVFLKRIITQFSNQFGVGNTDVPVWQLREMISYWFEQHAFFKSNYQNIVNDQRIIRVPIRQLVDNLEFTLDNLLDRLDLPFVHRDKIRYVNEQWLALQKYRNLDAMCENIVCAIIGKKEYEWLPDDLDIVSEAYIQFKLRTLYNLDLLCYNLDVFPLSAHKIRKLLIKYK